jgi:hypothetical protein
MHSVSRLGGRSACPGTQSLHKSRQSLRQQGEQSASRRPGSGPGRRRLILAALAGALALVAAGCASQASVRLPPRAVARAPARLQVADRPGPRQQVMAAYEGYWQASGDAVNAGNARLADRVLARYVAAAAIPGMIAALRQDWESHAVVDGHPILHILSVQVRASRATVHDCVDLSQAGLKDARTGQALPQSFGSARANYYASLVLQDGRWLVSNIVPVVAPCNS